MLKANNISVSYGKNRVISDLNLHIKKGEVGALLGANGAGKSTLLKAMSGIMPISKGSIIFEGNAVHDSSPESRVRQGIRHVPEGREIFQLMTTLENLEMGAYLRNDKRQLKIDIERIYSYFPILRERRRQDAGTLSGGEQQMLAIARALMCQPKLLLLDEPSLGLAPIVVDEIFQIIRKLRVEGTTIFLVEQNANMAFSVAEYGYIMEIGRIVLSGSTELLKGNKKIRQSYLGV